MGAAVGKALASARDAIRRVGEAQRTAGLDDEDLLAWGSALFEIIGALGAAAQQLEEQVTHYGDHRLLGDDLGADPYERLGEMRRHLAAITVALSTARVQAQAFHGCAGHIEVAVDPNAPRG